MSRPLRVAIVGAGPAGVYAGNIVRRLAGEIDRETRIDLFESLPAPYGLIRYGVAPDHPRIKGIVNSLHEMLGDGTIRFLGNIEVGRDVSVEELRERYDAVIIATGALRDAPLDIPGIDFAGSYGAADVVAWYDGHPDVPRTWPLEAKEIAVIGNGNVALDVARVLAKHPKDLLTTDIPANVVEGLEASPVTDVHVFGRRGPADVKFTPIELRELGEVPDVDVVVYEDDFARADVDDHASGRVVPNNQVKVMVRTLNGWRHRNGEPYTASRRLHLHFFHSPAEVLGDSQGRVEGVRFERTRPIGEGRVEGTGEFVDYPVQAVYRAVGYASSPMPGLPFDESKRVVSNVEGRVVDESGAHLPGVYATGWIKRGPVGLIGHTKGDALETITHLIEDLQAGELAEPTVDARDGDEIVELLEERGVEFTTWDAWLALDAHERALGDAWTGDETRERVKVVPRDEQVSIARSGAALAR